MSPDASSHPPSNPTPGREGGGDGPVFVFAGGGSGGHIYPGMAIAFEMQRLAPGDRQPTLIFVTSDRAIDAKITGSMQHPVEPSPAKPMIASPKGVIRFLKGWRAARRHAREVLTGWSGKRTVIVVAMGGFVAAPFAREAKSLGVPVTMVNLDAVPGKANRYIAKLADHIFTAARVPEAHKPRSRATWTEVPPIVRSTARAAATAEHYRKSLNLDPHRPVLMITGGSQGLRSLNEFITTFAASPAGQRTLRDQNWQVLHQTGRNLDEPARAAWQRAGIDAVVVPFNDQMGAWYGAADLVLSTAGAGNIAEIWQSKTPALLLPYPHHKDEHQKFNAAPLVECGGAALGKDWIDPARNVQHNGPTLEALLANPAKRHAMRVNLEKLGPADGARKIAQALLAGIPATSPAP